MIKISTIYRIAIILTVIAIFVDGVVNALYPRKYEDYIQHYSAYFGVDNVIIYSIINCESGYNKDAKSSAGAIGLMQIMPDTGEYLANLLGISNFDENMLFNPRYNIMLGTYYVSILLERYGDLPTTLASYNAGPGKVDKWLRDKKYSSNGLTIAVTPYAETNAYIEKVQKNIETYSKLNKKH